jgi:hypothetical protein
MSEPDRLHSASLCTGNIGLWIVAYKDHFIRTHIQMSRSTQENLSSGQVLWDR